MSPIYPAGAGGNTPVPLLQPGVSGYLLGSRDSSFPTTRLQITNVALTSNVATVTVLVRSGKIPVAGALISITGTAAASGAFNVSNIAISTVSIDAVTGIGTITFALTHADVVSAPDAGQGYVPVPEVGEALVNGKSQAFAIQDIAGHNENGLTVTWSTFYPSAPSTVTMTLQAAMVNQDAQFETLDTSTNTGGDVRSTTFTRYRFLRVVASNVTGGTNPTAVVRLDI